MPLFHSLDFNQWKAGKFPSIALMLALLSFAPAPAHAALNIPITVNLSEAVNVTGTPQIAVDVGGTTRYATYTSGTGTNALTFTLAPQAGDVDLDGVTVSSPIQLNGGTIKDTKGNPLSSLAFTPPNTANVKVNYPSLGMDFVYDADGRYSLNGTVYNDLPSFLTAAGGTFTRASIGTYYDSTGTLQTAASGVPRFDYDPVTHTAKGILIEESRTNLLPQSQIDSLWVAAGTTPPTVSNSQTYLGIPCVAVTFTSSNTSTGYTGSRATRTGTGAPTAAITTGTQYASSMFISASRALTGSESIGVYFTGSNGFGITYLNSSTSSTYVGKWVRSAMTPVTATVTGNDYPTIFLNNTVSSPVTIYISRGQIEVGSFSTSYIPTTTTTVARAADDLVIPAGGWLNGNAGTLFGEAASYNATATLMNTASPTLASINMTNGNALARVGRYTANTGLFQSQVAGVNLLSLGTWNNATSQKIAGSYDSNGFSAILGTNSLNTNGAGSLAGTLNQLRIGQYGTSGYWSSTIAKVKYYPARVPNTQLQLMTQ